MSDEFELEDIERGASAAMNDLYEDNRQLEFTVQQLRTENAELRTRLLSAAGDDLCRLTQEEIEKYRLGKVQLPPKCVFIESCEAFHDDLAAKDGTLKKSYTLAQMIAENEKLREACEAVVHFHNGGDAPAEHGWSQQITDYVAACKNALSTKGPTNARSTDLPAMP